MSAETEFRAVLAGYAGLTALVSTRIAQNSIEQGAALPYVVFSSQQQPTHGLNNTLLATQVTFATECWADTAAAADAVADQVLAALAAQGVVHTARVSGFDPELGLDATVLTVEWWD